MEILMGYKKIKDRRDFLVNTFNTGLFAGFVGTGLIGPLVKVMANIPSELPPGQSIYDFDGDVTVDDKTITEQNMKTTLVRADSTLTTGVDSWITFAVGKDAHNLRENSRLKLEGSGFFEKAMRLVTGSVLSVFASRVNAEDQYKVHTSTATVGIRGTGLYVESEPTMNRSYVCNCYGDINISSTTNPAININIKTTHHDNPQYIYADDSQGDIIQPAPFKNHTDEELQLIETIVGRNTPFSSVKEAYPRPRKDY